MAATSSSKVLRTSLALLAAVALLGACGGDDADDDARPSADDLRIDKPCELIDIGELSSATGIAFDASQPGENSCTYTSSQGLSAIQLNAVDLNGVAAQVALDQARGSCAEGTLKELEVPDADGGFACSVSSGDQTEGVTTVAVAGGGKFAVLTGATLDENGDDAQVLQGLGTLLEHALSS